MLFLALKGPHNHTDDSQEDIRTLKWEENYFLWGKMAPFVMYSTKGFLFFFLTMTAIEPNPS